jgi:hypothetical protein
VALVPLPLYTPFFFSFLLKRKEKKITSYINKVKKRFKQRKMEDDIGLRLFEQSRRQEPIDIAQTRRFLERATKQRAWTKRELDDFFAKKKGPAYDDLKEYIFRYQNSSKQKAESYSEMEIRHKQEIEMEKNSPVGYMMDSMNPKETMDQMKERHGLERLINTNKTLSEDFIHTRYEKLMKEEKNNQRRSYLRNINNYLSKNFYKIRGMSENELLQHQRTEQEMQKTNTPWITDKKTTEKRREKEEEQMTNVGANLREGTNFYNAFETDEQQSVRQVMERRILTGEFSNLDSLKKATENAVKGVFPSTSQGNMDRLKTMHDIVSYYNMKTKETLQQLKDRQRNENILNHSKKTTTKIGQEMTLTLFMY